MATIAGPAEAGAVTEGPPAVHFTLDGRTPSLQAAGKGITVTQKVAGRSQGVAIIKRGQYESRILAPAGSTITLSPAPATGARAGHLQVSVTSPEDKLTGGSLADAAMENAKNGRSIITDVMLTGMSYEDAVRDFGSLLEPSEKMPTRSEALRTVQTMSSTKSDPALTAATLTPKSAEQASAAASSDHRSGRLTTPVPSAPSPSVAAAAPVYYDTLCDYEYIDGDVHMRACDVRYLDYKGSNGQWYLSHKMQVSAQYDSLWSAMDNTWMRVTYPAGGTGSGNTFVDVEPYQAQTVGQCTTQSYTAAAKGFSISNSQQICPQRVQPKFVTHGYGVEWQGLSSYWRGAHGVGVVSSPPGAASSRTVIGYLAWTIK